MWGGKASLRGSSQSMCMNKHLGRFVLTTPSSVCLAFRLNITNCLLSGLAGAVHTAGTARLYLFRLLPDLAPACSSRLSSLFKLVTSWVSFPVCCCGTPSVVETGPSLFSSTMCWTYEASCAKAVASGLASAATMLCCIMSPYHGKSYLSRFNLTLCGSS